MTYQPAEASTSALTFPPGFVWGAATASFQIEGAVHEHGRSPSIWDTFCREPGAVVNKDDGDVACDHVHRYREDVDLMAALHLGAYRFSIAWPRVRPDGGAANPAGLDFYSRLVDSLLERGITPWPTLYHWDLPQALEDRGGWATRDTAARFAEYAVTVQEALGDRISTWTTFNEPWCSAFLGYAGGQHAPGRQEPAAAVAAVHHLLLAHGLANQALRAADPSAQVGITLNFTVADPADPERPEDVDAARRIDAVHNRVFLDPVLHGRYHPDTVAAFASRGLELPVQDGDLETIGTGVDFIGVNYYHGDAFSTLAPEHPFQGAEVERPTSSPMVGAEDVHAVPRGLPRTAMDWEVQPDGLRRLLERLHSEYTGPAGVALYITENGAAFDDEVEADGSVEDLERARYVEDHVRAVHAAIQAGADVRGYFAWSLLDNFEWAYGYAKRFGIVRVDFDTLERTPKLSALRYAEIARTGRVANGGSVPG
ncbi:beta-glucosidase [Actinotalea sp. BY-33]|uniref:Beta-glucosidase n=1 Tax=Actinotalea soli TaxID=2819234 RepID=A0A939RWY2_9CELL|nr:GH1 family beta-glucosidase [Actinotalea soli]MBO1752636.1 beta-glucosidase [Actinotalea soli]